MVTKNSGEAAGFEFVWAPQKDAGVKRRQSKKATQLGSL